MQTLKVSFECFDCGAPISFLWGLTPTIKITLETCRECGARYVVHKDGTVERLSDYRKRMDEEHGRKQDANG